MLVPSFLAKGEGIVYATSDSGRTVTVHTPTGGRSREYSTMGESLIERYRVVDEVLRHVNIFYGGGSY